MDKLQQLTNAKDGYFGIVTLTNQHSNDVTERSLKFLQTHIYIHTVYIYTYTLCTYIYMYIYMYIYIERETYKQCIHDIYAHMAPPSHCYHSTHLSRHFEVLQSPAWRYLTLILTHT